MPFKEAQQVDGTRLAKRRRLEMPSPDGFITSAGPRLAQRAMVPKFSSAFGDEDSALDAKSKGETPDSKVRKRPVVSLLGGTSAFSVPEKTVTDNPSKPRSSKRDRLSVAVQEIHNSISRETPRTSHDAPLLKPARPPPRPPVSASSIPSTSHLKPIPPPAFPVDSKPPSKALKPLHPPMVQTPRKALVGKDLRTISTTVLGRFNDLSAENGGEDLAAILLRDQHPEIYTVESDREDPSARGLELSPEKKGKGNADKFIRGGLAARASAYYERSHTSLILWQKEVEHRTKTAPDLVVTIAQILCSPLPPRSFTKSTTMPGIALCRIQQQKESTMEPERYKADQLYRIVFSFCDNISAVERFREGASVRIYRSWQEVSFSALSTTEEPHSHVPARLPLPLSLPTSTPDAPINDIALVCSRFLI